MGNFYDQLSDTQLKHPYDHLKLLTAYRFNGWFNLNGSKRKKMTNPSVIIVNILSRCGMHDATMARI